MKIIINENQLDKIMGKLKPLFDSEMEEFKNLIEIQREYEDWDTGDVYMAYVYYVDPEVDWEDDEFVFKIIPIDEDNDLFNLEYDRWMFRNIIPLFNKNIFEVLFKDWFEKTYKQKIENLYPV